jgi:hypothetical protein
MYNKVVRLLNMLEYILQFLIAYTFKQLISNRIIQIYGVRGNIIVMLKKNLI